MNALGPLADIIRSGLECSADLKRQVVTTQLQALETAAAMLVDCAQSGGTVLFCGNGGSAADAQHLAAELVGRFKLERRPLPALALAANISSLTGIGNDYGYEMVFERQVYAFGRAGDVLVAISTSGKSQNVTRAAQAAKARGLRAIALTGSDGGSLKGVCDVSVVVPSSDVARVQEAHITIGHIWCDIVEKSLFGSMA